MPNKKEINNINDVEPNVYVEIKKQIKEYIKYIEEMIRKFARKQGLSNEDLKYIDMTFFVNLDFSDCIEYIKNKASKPKDPINILKMIDEGGLTNETRKELKKYLNSL